MVAWSLPGVFFSIVSASSAFAHGLSLSCAWTIWSMTVASEALASDRAYCMKASRSHSQVFTGAPPPAWVAELPASAPDFWNGSGENSPLDELWVEAG